MKQLPSIQFLRECLSYNMETGACTWLYRPRWHFKSSSAHKRWNTIFGGKDAGTDFRDKRATYRLISLNYMTLRAHRVIWAIVTGEWPNEIDHKDGNGLNNKWGNLSNVDKLMNMKNMRGRKGRDLPSGVYLNKKSKRYIARITTDGCHIHVGTFITPSEAFEARQRVAKRLGFSERHGL